MKVVLSAYACEPAAGSEPGTGWQWAVAAAEHHQVWLVTRANHRGPIDAALAERPSLPIVPVYVDLPPWARRWKRGQRGVRTYYVAWQLLARRTVRRLHRDVRFDVAHHVTFAIDWLPAGVVGIPGLPSVWGPVGGASRVPWRTARWFGVRSGLTEVARLVAGAVGRCTIGTRTARRADVVVVQNDDVAHRFRRHHPIVEPHVAVEPGRPRRAADARPTDTRVAVFAGRLVRWKGVRLAIAALARPEAADWRLRIFGAGPDDAVLRADAQRLGVAARVTFEGQVPRDALAAAFAEADALLFPSLHDSAGWVVAEAITAGLPVVCLDVAGPPVLVSRTGGGIAVPADRSAPAALARALGRATPPLDDRAVRVERLSSLTDDWYARATGGAG